MKSGALGSWGEERAAGYLREKGYRILDRNWRGRYGELDLIALRDGVLVFAEVKLRRSAAFGAAREFVTAAKQQKLRMTAAAWLAAHPRAQELAARFDVIEIYAPQGAEGPITIAQLEDAFQ